MSEKVSFGNEHQLMTNSPDDSRLKKNWGTITALPSEYLVHFRGGQIREKTSGQGASCFKTFRDTIFIVPTSLKEIIFQANQLTADNVDIRIRGMAVYRIEDPLKIYKLINFSHRQQAEKKLAGIIADMCRSTAKWLVANMNVEECIRKRKEEIAESLKKEVARVVAADEGGWGVEIVTIDIQDVYIQDAEIFNAMQMMFKTEKIRESKLAELAMGQELEMKKLKVEESLSEQRKSNQINKAQVEAEIRDEEIRLARQNDEKQFDLDHYRVEQNESISRYKLEQEMESDRQRMQLELEKTQKRVEARKMENQEQLEALRQKIEVENSATPISLEKNFIEKAIPQIAQSISENMHDVKMNIYQQDGKGGSPFSFVLTEILDLFKQRMEIVNRNIEEE